MKFLVDNALSPVVSERLNESNFEANHVRDMGLQDDDDKAIFEFADKNDYVIVSADTDFSLILSQRQKTSPSVILFRGQATRRPVKQAHLIVQNFESFKEELKSGSVLSIRLDRIRVRALPIYGKKD